MQIAEFIAKHGFEATSERTDSNPNMASRDMDHWRVVLRAKGRKMTIPFSMGFGHKGKPPEADDVLNCIGTDSRALDMTLEDFTSEFGYEDAKAARKTWNACRKQGQMFADRFGADLLKELQECEPL